MKTITTAFHAFALIVLAILGVFCVWGLFIAQAEAQSKPGILVNITSGKEDLHAVSMGLGLAATAREQGREVVVFLNVEAAVFATKSLGEEVKIADFPPVKQMVAKAMAAGAKVMVCGHCSHVCNIKPDDIAEGIAISEHGDILNQLQPGMIGFSY